MQEGTTGTGITVRVCEVRELNEVSYEVGSGFNYVDTITEKLFQTRFVVE